MTFNIDILTAIIASLSLGGLLSVLLQNILQNRTKVFEQGFSFKETRYKAIMILMWADVNPQSELKHLKVYRDDIPNQEALIRELKLELYNAVLYAGDEVLKALAIFIKDPHHQNYSRVALAMRRDLYGKKTKIEFDDIKIE
jgi:hypothetical protein